jgi:archaemetzincin
MHIHIFWDLGSPAGFQMPVSRNISAVLDLPIKVSENPVRLSGYVDGRRQIDAKAILDNIQVYKQRHGITEPVLLVIQQDLFSRHHSSLFGLAREPVGAAVVSTARLENEYYGKDRNDDDLIDRITKEGAHEIGHLLGFQHCNIPECIMFRPDTLDELDRKKKMFCPECSKLLDQYNAGSIDTVST